MMAEAEQILDSINDFLESQETKNVSLVFCPPLVFVEEVSRILKTSHLSHQAFLGVQDIATEDGPMLKELGADYVIVGHSERRWKLGESNEIVNKKIKSVLGNELIPIVCIGEKVRDQNFKDFLEEQVKATLFGLSSDEVGKCIFAYEPVWAISTSPDARPDSPESAVESISVIKTYLFENFGIKTSPLFLYGGSVNSRNIKNFIVQKEIDGVLVGGASIDREEFVKILFIVSKS